MGTQNFPPWNLYKLFVKLNCTTKTQRSEIIYFEEILHFNLDYFLTRLIVVILVLENAIKNLKIHFSTTV